MASAALAQGHSFIAQRPPNIAAALGLYTTALDTARQCGDLMNEGDSLRAIAMATVGLGRDDAVESCRDALFQLHEIWYWYGIWPLFESIGLSLATTGNVEAASIIVGNLEVHRPPFGNEHGLHFRFSWLLMKLAARDRARGSRCGRIWTYAPSMTDESSDQHPEPVVVATFPDRGEAEVTKAHLAANGIEAYIVDEVLGGMLPVDGEASVTVHVPAQDAEAARRVLASNDPI